MYHIEWPIILIAIVAEIFGTASGLGSSILFLPAAQYFESPQTVLILTALLHVFSNSARVYLFWDPKAIKPFFGLIAVFILTSALGAVISTWTTRPNYEIALGSLLIIFVILKLALSAELLTRFRRFQNSITGVSGFLTGWLGTGGAIRAIALSGFALQKNQFIFVSSSIDLGGDFLRSIIYLYNGYLEKEHLLYIPVLAICAWIGSRIGKRVVGLIPQRRFEQLTLATIFMMGLSMIFA